MLRRKSWILPGLMLFFCWLISCKKGSVNQTTALSDSIRAFVPQSVPDAFQENELMIYTGIQPPYIEGIYLILPNLCTYDNSGSDRTGTIGDDFKYQSYNLDNTHFIIQLNDKNVTNPGVEQGTGIGAFLARAGNRFSAFVGAKGSDQRIQDFQKGLYVKSKDPDPGSLLIDVGSMRIFQDQDGLADKMSSY